MSQTVRGRAINPSANKSAPFAHDINVTSRKAGDEGEVYTHLEREDPNIGLEMETQKAKILTQSRTIGKESCIGVEDSVTVQRFTYVRVKLNTRGAKRPEKQHRVISANRAYNTSRRKFMALNSKNRLQVFERNILAKIVGPLNEDGTLKRCYNHELHELYKEAPISENHDLQRLRWEDHHVRIE